MKYLTTEFLTGLITTVIGFAILLRLEPLTLYDVLGMIVVLCGAALMNKELK